MSKTGVVFHIQRFSIHDGPGIRTTVFLKSCAMSCFWCHNPEGGHPHPEIQYFQDRCIACGECVKACPNHAHEMQNGQHIFLRERCQASSECVETCYSNALELTGKHMRVEGIMEEVLRDRAFYESSNGGVTLSGGEPALQRDFARELLERCKGEGIHTAIETCGYSRWQDLEALLPVTDLIMMDIKLMTPDKHQVATGNSNQRILANARRLTLTDKPIIFRTPVVPTVNDSQEEIGKIVTFVRRLMDLRRKDGRGTGESEGIKYELLPFHKLASDKYFSLGLENKVSNIDPPTKEKMLELANVAKRSGVDARIR